MGCRDGEITLGKALDAYGQMMRPIADAGKAKAAVRAALFILVAVERNHSAGNERERTVAHDTSDSRSLTGRLGEGMRERERRKARGEEKVLHGTS